MPSISIQAVAATMKTWKAGSCFLLAIAAFGVQRTSATPCAAYDGTGSVAYVFGAPYGDLSLGTDLLDPSAFVSLTNKTGRPDFTGSNTQCFVVSLHEHASCRWMLQLTRCYNYFPATFLDRLCNYFTSLHMVTRINSPMASTSSELPITAQTQSTSTISLAKAGPLSAYQGSWILRLTLQYL